MYEILHFKGGLYRFNELSEYIEDIGGMVLSLDHFELSRGDYYLSTEVHVLLMLPENELDTVKLIIESIKGMAESVELDNDQMIHILSYLSIYDALDKISWTEKEYLKEIIACPCFAQLCKDSGDSNCLLQDKFDEILEEMVFNKIIESKIEEDKVFFRLTG